MLINGADLFTERPEKTRFQRWRDRETENLESLVRISTNGCSHDTAPACCLAWIRLPSPGRLGYRYHFLSIEFLLLPLDSATDIEQLPTQMTTYLNDLNIHFILINPFKITLLTYSNKKKKESYNAVLYLL